MKTDVPHLALGLERKEAPFSFVVFLFSPSLVIMGESRRGYFEYSA